ncbi:MAG TPA: hypothetical protein IAA98_08425 [Candidatus Avipropionibacterium avicola]|uniref:Uncharacterized protein n=1 Tax=Candidatus Avipropionibacterium avicola TaxID=2840701 RepID=A0A9D1H023_9ACTN|nr:hypothetical protein [Candidatus Avipropionibacterium avicola]
MVTTHSTSIHPDRISRRVVLGGLAGVGAATTLAAAGCSTDSGSGSGSGGGGQQGANQVLPTYQAYEGVTPTYPAEPGRTSAAFESYPADPPRYAEEAPGDGTPVTFMGPTSFAAPPPLRNNTFWQEMNARVGSDLDINLTPAGEYDAKFATSVAGDQLPDMFYIGGMASLPQFMTSKAADLTEYLSGDNILNYPGLANIPTDSWRECIFDGTIRSVPLNRGLVSLPSILVREDVLAEKGISSADATDFEALYDLSKELTGGDVFAWTGAPTGHIRNMLDIPHTWVLGEDGKLTTSLQDERQEQALEASRRLVADGLVHPEAAGTPVATRKLWFGSGTGPLHPDSFIAWFSLYIQNADVEGIEIQALPMAGFNGGQGTQALPRPNAGRTAINASAGDRIPTLLKIADWLAAPTGTEEYRFNKYGVEDHNFTLEGSDPVPTDKADEVNIGSLYICDAARAIYSPGRPAATQSAWEHQKAVTEKAVEDPTYGLYSETYSRRITTLNRALDAVREDIMAGRKPVSAWKPAAEDFMKKGGTKILEEFQQALDADPTR